MAHVQSLQITDLDMCMSVNRWLDQQVTALDHSKSQIQTTAQPQNRNVDVTTAAIYPAVVLP